MGVKDSREAMRPKVAGSISETSCVRNFCGIYEVAVRYGGVQRRIVSSTDNTPLWVGAAGRVATVKH
jgi:hypothetical protein